MASSPAMAVPAPRDEPTAPDPQRIHRIVRRCGGSADALIEVLHRVQEIHGYLPAAALLEVARELQLPLSRVYGVASFYHLFRLLPPTPHRCAVCLGTTCFVKGGGLLARELELRLGVRLDDPAGNGTWALERISCLGACGLAPVLVVDGRLEPQLPAEDPAALAGRLTALGLPGRTA